MLQWTLDRGEWPEIEQGHHINVFELMAVKFSILTFTKNLSNLTIHIQMNNKAALPYPLENRVHTV